MSRGILVVMVTAVMLPAFTGERCATHSATHELILHNKKQPCVPQRDTQRERERENHNYLRLDSNSMKLDVQQN